jgi:hypothetical protein
VRIELSFDQEWIAFAFFADRGQFAVAGDYYGFVGEGEECFVDGTEDFFMRAAGEIGAAYRSREEGVAGDQLFFCGEVEADAAFGVARGVEDLGGEGAGCHRLSGGDAAIDFYLPGRSYADPGGLRVEHLQKIVIVLVEQDGCAGGGAEFHGSADVVDVGVGDDDLLDLEIVLADYAEHIFDFVAGVDDHGFVSGFVADDGAVALQEADGEDFVDHGLHCTKHYHRGDTDVTQGIRAARFSLCSSGPLWL